MAGLSACEATDVPGLPPAPDAAPAIETGPAPAADGPALALDLPGADQASDLPPDAAADGGVRPSCTNGIQDGLESDIDCGGACPLCLPFRRCQGPADCLGHVCDARSRLCQPSCSDRLLDGDETDVDCGGPCGPCRPLRDCRGPADCTTGLCAFLDHGDHCFPLGSCANGKLDGTETDRDCGGDFCAPCPSRRRCLLDADCTTFCGLNGYCL